MKLRNIGVFYMALKLHSWNLAGTTSTTEVVLSFANILNDFNANFNIGYNRNEEVMQYAGNISYGKFYTLLNLGSTIGERDSRYLTPVDTLTTDEYNERTFRGGLSLPLQWLNGNFSTSLNIAADFVHHRLSDFNNEQINRDKNFNTIQLEFSLANIRRRATTKCAHSVWASHFSCFFQSD